MAAVIPELYPLNDFVLKATLKDVDPLTGKEIPLTTGTVTAFLATTNTPTATAADPSLTTNATHVGKGVWLIVFDGATLLPALLGSLFGSGTPYVIIQQTGGIRAYAQLAYVVQRPAEVS